MSNPIDPGFEWTQGFDFPSDFLQDGDGLRAEFRPFPNSPTLYAEIETNDGIVINDNRVFVTLSPAQTIKMAEFEVVTNFVLQRDGREIPIGQIIRCPVRIFPTRP